jgi:hypothetical protein
MLSPDYISPFTDKLVPTEAEIKDIRALLMDPIEQLARIQAQIDEMEVIVGQLKAKHSSLKTVIDAHEALISPVRRAPDLSRRCPSSSGDLLRLPANSAQCSHGSF